MGDSLIPSLEARQDRLLADLEEHVSLETPSAEKQALDVVAVMLAAKAAAVEGAAWTPFQAIVNAPQAAILAVGRISERPFVVDGALLARPVLSLNVSFDHRVVDGAHGARFLETLASLIEEPALVE